MTIAYTTPTTYEFSIGYGGVDSVTAAPSFLNLTPSNINPVELLSFTRKHGEAMIPEGDGARYVSDGKVGPDTITLFGTMVGDDPEDTFSTMAGRLSVLATSTPQSYLKAGLFDGAAKVFFRRYGIVMSAHAAYQRKTNYEVISGFEMEYRILDPWWYFDTARAATATYVATTGGSFNCPNFGVARSKRALITITNNNGSTWDSSTTVTVTNLASQSFVLTGTLPDANDKWVVDMMLGTVTKYTGGGGTASDDIANFTGMFFGIQGTLDQITVTTGASRSFTARVDYIERRM